MSHAEVSIHKSDPLHNQICDRIMDNLDEMIWSLALPDLNPIYFNAAAINFFQHSPQELMEHRHLWLEAIATEDRRKIQQELEKEQKTDLSIFTFRIQLPTGKLRHFHARLKVFKDSSGLPIRLDAIAYAVPSSENASDRDLLDIPQSNIDLEIDLETDLEIDLEIDREQVDLTSDLTLLNEELERQIGESDRNLRDKESRNLSILHALPDLLLLLKPDGTCIECIIPSGCDKAKYLPIQHHISEVLPPETLAAQLKLYDQAIATGEVQIYEHQLFKFGKLVHEEVRIAPYCKDELVVIVRDITERKETEQQLQNLTDRLTLALKSAAIGIWERDLVRDQLVWDRGMYELYGVSPEQFTNNRLTWLNYVYPSDREIIESASQLALQGKKDYDIEFRIVLPNGSIRYIQAYALLQRDGEGIPQRFIGINFDITERKIAETKIIQTARQLANTNHELESFSYSVSHDLRAPLRHMNGFVMALQQQLQKHEALNDPKVEHYLQVIAKSSQKMGHLIDGLLTLSRYGRRSLESTQIPVRVLVDEAIAILRNEPSYNPMVKFSIGDLPVVIGDPILLQQVFCNLIGNAVKFSRTRANPHIIIDSLPDQTIRIQDNGVGFQIEYAEKLFGAFQRLHNEREFEGTGIGLAIVQRIVQRHGGSIWAEGYPDRGATFFLKI
ncbi:PAS domain-containing protein [Pseudanabaena sp. UWO310]|uniref:PAS domain-containing sensor histidine kinase n=1 Tax=Pseudanabaena sp. UWO310 TaxID=2480795 RepID=UPI001157FD9F|nr:PAS domain-containing protein [Pseudanabaena sp. UWO310]TYQ28851.1 PAS domain-containing protein [Pseudanabaena sp. UWO310]